MATITADSQGEQEHVQVPDHNNCPPASQLSAIGTAIVGAVAAITAWFKEDLWGFTGRRKKDFDEHKQQFEQYKQIVDRLARAHDAEEQEKLINSRVEEAWARLKQRPQTGP